jgi:hypothetical protein
MKTAPLLFVLPLLISIISCNNESEIAATARDFKMERDSLSKIVDSLHYHITANKDNVYPELSDTASNRYLYPDYDQVVNGVATIQGYYLQKEKTERDDTPVHCNCFAITAGPEMYLKGLLKSIAAHNEVNFKNEKGQPVICIDTNDLPEEELRILKSSSAENPVRMTVYIKLPMGICVPVCYSTVAIIKVF